MMEGLAYGEENCVVKPWGKFKLDLCNLLLIEERRQAAVLVRGQISENRREKLMKPDSQGIDLLEALEDAGIINEDCTDPLIEILRAIGNIEALEDLDRYRKLRDQYRKNVKLLSGKHDPLFVGRNDYIRAIIDVFGRSPNLVSCVCLYGLAGTGKTTLAVETSAIYKELQRPQPSLIKVDLRKRSNVTDAGITFLTAVGRHVSAKDFDLTMINEWIQSCTHQEHVILLDNADELLQPLSLSRDHFINMMTDLLMTQNTKVKFIITTRYAMHFKSLNDKANFEEIEVKALEVHESIQLLVKEYQMAHGVETNITEKTAEEIANHCGNNPQALRAVAKRLKTGYSPDMLAKQLQKPKLAVRLLDPGDLGSSSIDEGAQESVRQELVLQSLKATFDMLSVRLQKTLVKLSVFPGAFDRQKASYILGIEDVDAVDVDINDLLQWSVVESEDFRGFENPLEEGDRQYAIHQLIRTVCMIEGTKGEQHNAVFADALERFCHYASDLMKNLSITGHTDYSKALGKFEEEKPLLTHYMEMDMGKTFSGYKLPSQLLEKEDSDQERAHLSTSPSAESIYNLFECFLDVEKLVLYFRCKTDQMKVKHEMEAWALLSGWLADQYTVQAKYKEAAETLNEPLEWLKSQPRPLSKDAELAMAQCQAIQGRYLSDKPDPNYKLAIKVLKEALTIRQKYFGDHSLTARCLNFLGHVYHRMKDVNNTKKFHEQSWEMLARITNNNPEQHFDAPTYAMNIGSAYHQLGNREMDKKNHSKAKEYYRHAISFFDRAAEIEKMLRLEGNPNTAVILKNKAMSYCEMEEYETALPLAIRASELRKKGIGTHPNTARSLYFVGSLYDSLGKKQKKAHKTPDIYIASFQDALKYYKEALQTEMKLGPERRSWEYKDLKADFKKLLSKQLRNDRQLQQYERLFQQAESSSFEAHFDAEVDAEAVVLEVPDDVDDASTPSGSPKRRLPGLEDMPESPKRSRCVMA